MGQLVQLSELNALPDAWRTRLEDVIPLLPSCRIVICYGSRWAGIPRPSSDYDMLMIGDESLVDQQVVELRRSVKAVWPDIDWRWLSVRGARANRLINPTLNCAIQTGGVLGDLTLLGEMVPIPIVSILGAMQDVIAELEDLRQWDDPWGDDGREYRQLAKRLVVLEQTLVGIADGQKLSKEVQRIMESPDMENLLVQRAEQIMRRACNSAANAGDHALEYAIHGKP